MDHILQGLPVFCYIDDVLVYSKTPEDHQRTITELLRRLQANGMAISLSKCVFGVQEIEFLGWKVSTSGIAPLSRKIEAI